MNRLYRDQLVQLQHVQASQGIEGVTGDLDIRAAAVDGGAPACRYCLSGAPGCWAARPITRR